MERQLTSSALRPTTVIAQSPRQTAPQQLSWWSGRRIAIALLISIFSWGLLAIGSFSRAEAANGDSIQPYIDRAIERIHEFTLENGIKFIVMERHQAPVVSFMTYVDVGAAEEPDGQTGAAHYLEHLAFKGTDRIGTTDYDAEKAVLTRLDTLFDQIQAAKAAEESAGAIAPLQAEFESVQQEASRYVIRNQMPQIVQKAGGVGLNATTSADATRYFYSFPANKLELWMSLESERFLTPVFREFYEEKDVILEERRMRVDNSPIGKMIEVFLEKSFDVHPYRRPVVGYADDLDQMTREQVTEFFQTYYTPDRMTFAIVGDVDLNTVKQMATTYFGRYPTRPTPPRVDGVEPPQMAPKEFTLELPSQPWYLEGYHRPGIQHPDHLVYDMLDSILSGGRTSRLYKSLVEEQQIALAAQSLNTFPGDRFANLMFFYVLTAPGHTLDEAQGAIATELDKLRSEPVTPGELERVKTQARAGLLTRLASNQGMASLLPEYEAKTGSWRNLFADLKAIDAITAADVMRVAQATFQPENRTIGRLIPPKE
ncbi:MAG: pitrilysin family protein [Leptolyngbyaceae bacterium]|nr:pitrilysin family protein [Leptolyngbyaceae bacterium]